MEGQKASLDRITCLPPTIIETILCLLPIQEAGRTSILSRDWRYKWTKIPELGFYEHLFEVSKHEDKQSDTEQHESEESDMEQHEDEESDIEQHESEESDMEQHDDEESDMEQHEDEESDMEQHEDEESDMEQPFVPWERKDMSKRFKLFYAIYQVLLAHRGPIVEFSLSLARTDDTCVEIDQIIAHLSRTNTVEILSLELGNDYRLPLSLFSMHQLRDLYLYMGEINHQPTFNGFNNLTSLYLDSVNISRKVLLHLLSKCPILKSVGLMLYLEDNIPANDSSTIFELFESLPLIVNLSITSSLIEDFADDVVPQVLPTALIHLKYCYLTDMCFLDSPRLPFLLLIIRSAPNLEKLKISFMSDLAELYTQAEIDAVKPQDCSDVRLEHLNILKITNFSNFQPEMVFLKHILANSPVLKKVSIGLDSMVAKNQHLQISRILSHCPCASPVVEISVKHSD